MVCLLFNKIPRAHTGDVCVLIDFLSLCAILMNKLCYFYFRNKYLLIVLNRYLLLHLYYYKDLLFYHVILWLYCIVF